MNDTDMQSMALRMELLQETIRALASVTPRSAARVAADAVRASVARHLVDADMPDAVDEQMATCLALLLTALESGVDSGDQPGAGPGHKMLRPIRPAASTAAKTFLGGVRPARRAIRRNLAR